MLQSNLLSTPSWVWDLVAACCRSALYSTSWVARLAMPSIVMGTWKNARMAWSTPLNSPNRTTSPCCGMQDPAQKEILLSCETCLTAPTLPLHMGAQEPSPWQKKSKSNSKRYVSSCHSFICACDALLLHDKTPCPFESQSGVEFVNFLADTSLLSGSSRPCSSDNANHKLAKLCWLPCHIAHWPVQQYDQCKCYKCCFSCTLWLPLLFGSHFSLKVFKPTWKSPLPACVCWRRVLKVQQVCLLSWSEGEPCRKREDPNTTGRQWIMPPSPQPYLLWVIRGKEAWRADQTTASLLRSFFSPTLRPRGQLTLHNLHIALIPKPLCQIRSKAGRKRAVASITPTPWWRIWCLTGTEKW